MTTKTDKSGALWMLVEDHQQIVEALNQKHAELVNEMLADFRDMIAIEYIDKHTADPS
jgi:hypothetical protein